MSKTSSPRRKAAPDEGHVLGEWQEGMGSWLSAVEAHKLAPPDVGFAARLNALSKGASEAARVCRTADAAGFQWPPARKADSEPPYELRAGTGRRGPDALWRRFDRAVVGLTAMSAGSDMLEVSGAFEELAAAAAELSEAVASEDGGASTSRSRSRRAAAR